MAKSEVIAARNEKIVEQLYAGARPIDVASAFNLSVSRVRAIRTQYAANGSASRNGSTSSKREEDAPRASGGLGEIGLTGLKHSAGYVHEEFLKELSSAPKRYKIYNEMRENEATIAAISRAIEWTLRGVEWRIDGEDDERKDFVEGARTDMSHSWNDFISEVLTMIFFGYAPFELVYKRRLGPEADVPSDYNDGKIGWRKFAFRSQDSLHKWEFDERGNVQAMVQMAYPDFKLRVIPLEKMLLFRTSKEKNNPEGRSLLRPCYISYFYASNLRAIEAIGVERDLCGLPVVKLPEGADTTDENSPDVVAAKELGRRVRVDEEGSVTLPFGWEIELLSAGGSKQFDVGEIIARYEKRMALTFLAGFLMLGQDKVGSFSLSKDLSDFFVGAISALLGIITETFNQYAIPRLLKINGMRLEDAPKLAHGPIGKPDLAVIQQYFGGLTAFIKPDVELEQHLRKLADAPELSEEEIERREEERERMMQVQAQQPTDADPDGEPDEDEEGKPPQEQEAAQQAPNGKQQKSPPNRNGRARTAQPAKQSVPIESEVLEAVA